MLRKQQIVDFIEVWSVRWDSNPILRLGRPGHNPYTTDALQNFNYRRTVYP